jgi:hypothetical protein
LKAGERGRSASIAPTVFALRYAPGGTAEVSSISPTQHAPREETHMPQKPTTTEAC